MEKGLAAGSTLIDGAAGPISDQGSKLVGGVCENGAAHVQQGIKNLDDAINNEINGQPANGDAGGSNSGADSGSPQSSIDGDNLDGAQIVKASYDPSSGPSSNPDDITNALANDLNNGSVLNSVCEAR